MKRKILFLVLLSVLLLCGCAKTNLKATEAAAPAETDAPATLPEQTTVPSTTPTTEAEEAPSTEPAVPEETGHPTETDVQIKADDPSTGVEADSSSFEGIIAQYQTAIRDKYDTARMMELGLNYMIPECLKQDERAQVGYSKLDMDGDGQTELVLSASSESEYYTGLIFAVYVMEDGQPQLLLESGERNRWHYAGDGKQLNLASGSASESGWYLCTADRELAYLDAIEYNAVEYPDDPWLKFNGETWEHTIQSEADQKIMELTNLVSNLEMTAF